MTTSPAPLTARTVSALVRQAIGNGNASAQSRTDTSVMVTVHGAAAAKDGKTGREYRETLARAVVAAAIQAGYDASRSGLVVEVVLPEPVEETVDQCVDRVLAANPSVARRVVRAEERARHEQAATRRAVAASSPSDSYAENLPDAPHRYDPSVEADVPPTADERVTVPVRARELRAGDEVVDSLGQRQYAAFDTDAGTHIADGRLVRVWTAIRDQEAGLPPVIKVPAERELLVLRPVSEEGRELLAALDGI